MIVKAAIGFLSTASDAELIARTQDVLVGMTGNTNFATPTPTLAMIKTALDAFSTALAEAANGGRQLTAVKNAKRAELVSLMKQLGSYLTTASNGDIAILLSSAFPTQKAARSPIGPVATPEAPKLSHGAVTGEINAVAVAVTGAYAYNWDAALASSPDVSVQTAQTTGARTTFSGLTPGQLYVVTLNALGAAGTSDWSNAAELMAI